MVRPPKLLYWLMHVAVEKPSMDYNGLTIESIDDDCESINVLNVIVDNSDHSHTSHPLFNN